MSRRRSTPVARQIPLDDLTRRPLPGMDHPTRVEVTRDGRGVTFLAPEPGGNVRALWRVDLGSGDRTLLASPKASAGRSLSREDDLRRQRRRETAFGITDYRRAADADLIVLIQGGRCLASRGGSPAIEIPGIRGAQALHPDPAGSRIAWVAGGDLWCTDLAAGEQRRLSEDGAPGISKGLEDYIAAEELDRFEGAWWSTNGAEILFAHVDERQIPVYAIEPGRAKGGEEHRYPFAGGPNPRTTLWIAAVGDHARAREVIIDFADGYLARVVPHPRGGWLVAALPRDQRSLHWYLVESSGAANELWVERSEPWINLDDATRILSDGRYIRATEASGYRHLELRNPDGSSSRRLTTGEWVVTDLVHVDEARGEVLFIGTADGVLERHLYVVPLDTPQPVPAPRRLTEEPGWHAVAMSDDGDRWVDTWSSRRRSPSVAVRSRDAGSTLVLHEPSADPGRAWMRVPDLLTLPAADGSTPIQVAVFRASRAEDTPPGPSIVWVYGGPHSQHVCEGWELTVEPYRQALVRAGFTVIVADNRGTANRGLAFESPIAGWLGRVEIEDQASVIESLARRGEVDLERVGITGVSYGGYLTVMAMARRPDLFGAGVAGAPVVDWAGYDTAYTERYLGTPAANPDNYRRSSLVDRAGQVQGELLILHGTRDENVHPRHTQWLQDALRAAGRDATVVMVPDERHQLRRPSARRRWLTLTINHLWQALGEAGADGALPRGQAAS